MAIYLGWAAGIILALSQWGSPTTGDATPVGPTILTPPTLGILFAGLGVTALGLFDDLHLASPTVKLIGAAAAGLVLIAFGLGRQSALTFMRSGGVDLGRLPPSWILAASIPLTLFIVVGACNATNLIDGLDGLCSGVLGIIAAGFLVLAVYLHLWNVWDTLDAERVVVASAMMGAALGFLPYNRNPARIFMGDAGSMLLGFNAAVLLLLFARSSNTIRWMLGSLMIFGLPLADMVLTLARRWRSQKPLMQGDRSHFYDQLIDRGWPVKRVVRTSYALAAFFAIMGCLPCVLQLRYIVPIYFLVVVAVAIAVKKLKMVRVERTQ